MRASSKWIAVIAILTLEGCTSKFTTTDDNNWISEETPDGSTGQMGSVSLNFASSTSLALADDPATVKIGDSIELSYAKFSIAKIKIKAAKDPSAEEEALQDIENAEESDQAADLDDMLDVGAELKKDKAEAEDNESQKKERQEKVKKHLDDLEDKEDQSLEKEASHDKATKFVGPYVYDAITGAIEGEAPKVDLVDGQYHRVEFQLKRNFKVDEEEPLLGNVFAIKGSVLNGEESVPFEIDWHVALNFRLTGDSPFSVDAADDNSLLIDFDMSSWFDGIDFTKADVDENGTIYVNKTSNHDIMKKLHKNIKASSGFGKDGNKDGKLQKKEKTGKGENPSDPS